MGLLKRKKKTAPKLVNDGITDNTAAMQAAIKADSALHPTQVANHPFAPRTKVGFYPETQITVERSLDREPFGDPEFSATVEDNGELNVDLPKGEWSGAGSLGDRWAYITIGVK